MQSGWRRRVWWDWETSCGRKAAGDMNTCPYPLFRTCTHVPWRRRRRSRFRLTQHRSALLFWWFGDGYRRQGESYYHKTLIPLEYSQYWCCYVGQKKRKWSRRRGVGIVKSNICNLRAYLHHNWWALICKTIYKNNCNVAMFKTEHCKDMVDSLSKGRNHLWFNIDRKRFAASPIKLPGSSISGKSTYWPYPP